MVNKEKHGFAIASFVLGICACISVFTGIGAIVGVILGIIGIVLSSKATNAGNTESINKAGKILSIVGLCVSGAAFIIALGVIGAVASLGMM